MATFTFGLGHPFPAGTTVQAFEDKGQNPSGSPAGVATASAVVAADSSLSITGLTEGKRYWIVALVSGAWKWVHVTARTAEVLAGEPVEIEDEGALLPIRRRMNFVGTAVTAQDDAPNELTRIVVGGVPGPPGAGALGVDVWATQGNPEAVTDWGPIINTLITGSGPTLPARLLLFRDKVFPFSTQIVVKTGVVFQGVSGITWPAAVGGALPVSRLVWKGGAGSGTAILGTMVLGFCERDMGVYYDNVAYNGDLHHLPDAAAASGHCVFERCTYGYTADNMTQKSARSLFNLNGGNQHTFRDCSFNNAVSLIRGWDFSNKRACTDHVFDTCLFEAACDQHVLNPADEWQFDHSVWEFSGPVTRAFGTDYGGIADNYVISLNLTDNWWWDGTGADQCVIDQPSNTTWKIVSKGNRILAMSFNKSYRLNGPGSLISDGDYFSSTLADAADYYIDCGDGTTAHKSSVTIVGPLWESGGSPPYNPVKRLFEHQQVNISGTSKSAHSKELTTISGHVRLGYIAPGSDNLSAPAIAKAAGQPAGITVDIQGNDHGGIIVVTVPAATVSIAGPLADVTFKVPMVTTPKTQGDANLRVPKVILSAAHVTAGTTTDGDASAAAAVSAAVSTSGAGFTLRTKNVVTGNVRVGWFYDVEMI